MVFLPRKLMVTAVLAALTPFSWAQTPPPAGPAAAPASMAAPAPGAMRHTHMHHHAQPGAKYHSTHPMGGMHSPEGHMASMQEHRAQHHAQLKQALQLSPAQESAWTEFTAAMEHAPNHARLDPESMQQLSTPERIDRMRALRTQRAAEADRRGDAVKAFYAKLNPAQQKTFDSHHNAHHKSHPMMMAHGPHGSGMPSDAGQGGMMMGMHHQQDCKQGGYGMHEGHRHSHSHRYHSKKSAPPAAVAPDAAPSTPAAK